jgi:hypothetical protein
VNQRDKITLAEAKSAVQQCCHILGNDRTQAIIDELNEFDEEQQ